MVHKTVAKNRESRQVYQYWRICSMIGLSEIGGG